VVVLKQTQAWTKPEQIQKLREISDQISLFPQVAAVVSFTLCLMHFLLGVFVQVGRNVPEKYVDAVQYISTSDHIRVFTSGLLDTRPLIYYASLAVLFLALTHQVVEFRRWKP
jgi:ABC-2 type transport system permease protein